MRSVPVAASVSPPGSSRQAPRKPSAEPETVGGSAMSAPGRSLRRMTTIVFAPDERPDIEVCIDGAWCPGELRMWQQREDGSWWANVNWSRDGQRYVDTLPADDIRPDERPSHPV